MTLVFSRIGDAAALRHRLGAQLRPVLGAHDEVLRATLGLEGYEVRREATGFVFAFRDAAAALRAVTAALTGLAALRWTSLLPDEPPGGGDDGRSAAQPRVSFGLHTGAVLVRTDPATGRMSYLGPTADLAARIAQATTGEQILLTQDTLSEAEGCGYEVESPDQEGVWLSHRGAVRLKGVAHTVPLFELRPKGLAPLSHTTAEHTAPLTETGTVANLPPLEGGLFGRDELLMAVIASTGLAGGRPSRGWTTLTGPPGVGKSRLAAEIGRWSLSGIDGYTFGGGVVWVDLLAARDHAELIMAVARAMRVELFGMDAEGQVLFALGARGEMLLVLDGAEHLVGPVGELAVRLKARAPQVSLLVTSRIAIGDPRELRIDVEPLPVPAAGAPPELIAQNPAVRLVFDRLRQHTCSRSIHNPAYLPAVSALVRRFDGLPHALVLAVSAPAQTPALEILDAAVTWVDAGLVDLAPTPIAAAALRASMARSWALLPPWAQGALAMLSVFRGGFRVEGAEAVVDLSAWPEAPAVSEVIDLLVRHHLVRAIRTGDDPEHRYALSSLWVAYALDRLAATDTARGGARELAEARHGRFYAQLGSTRVRIQTRRRGGGALAAALLEEQENLRAALRRAGRRRDPDTERDCAAALLAISTRQGPLDGVAEVVLPLLAPPHPVEKVGWLAADAARLLTLAGRVTDAHRVISAAMSYLGLGGSDALRARLLADIAAILRERRAGPNAGELLEKAMALARGADNPETLGVILTRHAAMLSFDGKPAASMVELDQAIRIARSSGDLQLEALALRTQGAALLSLGRPADALEAHRRATELYAEIGQTRLAAMASVSQIKPLNMLGQHEEAEALARALLPELQALGDDANLARAYDALGLVLAAQGRLDEGRRALEEALRTCRRTQSVLGLAGALTNLAGLFLLLERPDEAVALYTEAAPLFEGVGSLTGEGSCRAGLGDALATGGKTHEGLAEFALAETLLRRSQNRAALVGLLIRRGLVRSRIKHPEAHNDLKEAELLLATLQIQLDPRTVENLDALRAAIKARGARSTGRRAHVELG